MHHFISPLLLTFNHSPSPSRQVAGKDSCWVPGMSENLSLCKGRWQALWAEAGYPSSGEQLWAEAFLPVLYLLESFSGKNEEIKMKCQRLKSLGSSKSPLIPCFQRAEIIQMLSSFSTERQTALNSFIQFHHVFFFKTRLQRRCLNEWQPEH